MKNQRRFPVPWTAEPTPSGFVVKDANGQTLSYFYGEDAGSWRTSQLGLSADEARWLAVGFARLPELLILSSEPGRVPVGPSD
jgi:hypothetical protein